MTDRIRTGNRYIAPPILKRAMGVKERIPDTLRKPFQLVYFHNYFKYTCQIIDRGTHARSYIDC
jgi:hypothetical protein